MTKIQKSFESLSIIKRHIEQGATLVDGQYQSSDESEIAKMNVTWLNGAWWMFQQVNKKNPCFCIGDCGAKND